MIRWTPLRQARATELCETRLTLHYAAQLVSAAAVSWLPAKEDFSHTNLGWNDRLRALQSQPLAGASLALRLADCTLLHIGDDQHIAAQFSLAGKTMSEGLVWVGEQVATRLGHAGSAPTIAEHEMPKHPLADGAAFVMPEPDEAAELAGYFANAHALFDEVHKRHGGAPVRCWPHHFDIATLLTLDAGKSSEEARSVGVGMSPGDGGYSQPYIYVTPWPYPKADTPLPALSSGDWHTSGWTGAVLTGDRLASEGDQQARATRFLDSAIAGCFELLGHQP